MMGFITLHKAGSFLRRSALRYPSIRMSNEKKGLRKVVECIYGMKYYPVMWGLFHLTHYFWIPKINHKTQRDSSRNLRKRDPRVFLTKVFLPRNWPGTAPSEHSHPQTAFSNPDSRKGIENFPEK